MSDDADSGAAAVEALAEDLSITNPKVLTETGDRRFYQVDFTSRGDE